MKAHFVLCAFLLVPVTGMRIRCKTREDCTSKGELYSRPSFTSNSWCDNGYCVSSLASQKCSRVNGCGYHHSCMQGKCVLGGTVLVQNAGSTPSITLPVASDERTRTCVRGVAGVTCRHKDECGFGKSCYQVSPLPLQRAQRQGTCRPGTLDTYTCRRDSHCVGDLRCLTKAIATRDGLSTE